MENAPRPRYRLDRLLGSGTVSDVFLAYDFLLGQPVALKRFRRGPGSRGDLRKEFSLLSYLTHPHIVRVFDLQATAREGPFLTMDYLAGLTLKGFQERLPLGGAGNGEESYRRLVLPLIINTLLRIASALRYLHSRGILHGDLKPSNVIYRTEVERGVPHPDDLRLVDFNLSRAFLRFGRGDFSGTFRYSSPEQILGKRVDGRSDLFSLGILFYELLTGKHPKEGFSPDQPWADFIGGELVPPSWRNPLVPSDLDRIVRRLLQVDSAERYQQAGELMADLLSILSPKITDAKRLMVSCFTFEAGLAGRKGVYRRIIRQILDGRRKGMGRGVVILGREGSGKNRLVRAVRQRFKAGLMQVVTVNCLSQGRGPSSLMGEILRQLRLMTGVPAEKQNLDTDRGTDPIPSTGFQVIPFPAEEWERDREERWYRFAKILSGFSEEMGGAKGLLLVVEHVEAASREVRDLLLYLLRELRTGKIISLLTCDADKIRPEELNDFLRRLPSGSRIDLQDLELEDIQEALAAHYGKIRGLDGFAREVLERTMGNVALFEECINDCLQKGVIRRVSSGWKLESRKLSEIPISRSLEAAVLRRLRSLGREPRRFLGLISILDHRWEEDLLGRLFQATFRDWHACLRELVHHRFLHEEERGNGGEVLYRLMLPRLRKRFSRSVRSEDTVRFHHRWAELLEARIRQDPAVLPRVAGHYRVAGDRKKAIPYLVQAGERFLRDRDLAGAEQAFLSAWKMRPSISSHGHILLRLGEVAFLRGNFREGLDFFRRLAAKPDPPLEGPLSRREVFRRVSEGFEMLGRLREAEEYLRRALEEVRKERFPGPSIPIRAALGWIALRQGRIQEAERRLVEATRSARSLADDRLLAEVELKRGALLQAIGKLGDAEKAYRRCLALAKKQRHINFELKCYQGLGGVFGETDRLRAEQFLRKGVDLAETVGVRRMQGGLLTNLGIVLRGLGRWDEARDASTKAREILKALGLPEEARPLLTLGNLFLDRQDYGKAREAYRQAEFVCRKWGMFSTRVMLGVNLSILHQLNGEPDQASKDLGKCRSWIRKAGYPAQAAYLIQAARLKISKNRIPEARRFLSLVKPFLRSIGSLSLDVQEHLLKGTIYLRSGEGGSARREFDLVRKLSGKLKGPDRAWIEALDRNLFRLLEGNGKGKGDILPGVNEGPCGPGILAGPVEYSTSGLVSRTGGQPAMNDSDAICQVLYELAGLCRSFTDSEGLPDQILSFTLRLSGAERGFIFLREDASGELRLVASRRADRETVTDALEISRSILKGVLRRDFPTYSTNALQDRRFKNAESVVKYRIRSFICAPMRHEERILGTIYLDHKTTGKVFEEKDAKLLFAIATFVAPVIVSAGHTGKLKDRVKRLQGEVFELYGFENIIGRSRKMQEVYRLVEKVKDTDASVLLLGETGTGKELMARTIHFQGHRKQGSFVAVNCAAIPDTLIESELFGVVMGAATDVRERRGKFEEANGGTIFLDEIADLSLNSQAKILRTLQERSIERVGSNVRIPLDVRIISATNRDLKACFARGEFREDLYFRLNVIPVHLPPLRERQADIPVLMAHFVEHFSRSLHKPFLRIPKETVDSYRAYSWPGNVREIRSVIEREVILADGNILLPLEHGGRIDDIYTESIKGGLKRSLSEDALTRDYTRKVLKMMHGNKRRACELLEIDFKTLQRRMGSPSPGLRKTRRKTGSPTHKS